MELADQKVVVEIKDAMQQAVTRVETNLDAKYDGKFERVKAELGSRFDEMKADLAASLQAQKDLYDANVNRQIGFNAKHTQTRFFDDVIILDALTSGKIGKSRIAEIYAPHFAQENGIETRALTISGMSGTAIFPTGFSSDLEKEIRLNLLVASQFREIKMPHNVYKKPFRTNLASAQYQAENAAATALDWTDSDITFTAKRLVAYMQVTDEVEITALFPVMDEIRDAISRSLADAIEQSIIDADLTGTHMDSDVTSATDCRKLGWNGLRKLTNASAKLDLSTFSFANLMALRKLMKRFGAPNKAQQDLVWIVGLSVYMQLLTLTEFKTVDLYGNSATNTTGEIGKIGGIPVICSQFVRENLNASGVYDGVTTTKTICLLVNKPSFQCGQFGEFGVESDRVVKQSATDIVATTRRAFARLQTESATLGYASALGYNITS